jgi:hypothetical protein
LSEKLGGLVGDIIARLPDSPLCYSLLFWSLGTHCLVITASITSKDLQVVDYNIQTGVIAYEFPVECERLV